MLFVLIYGCAGPTKLSNKNLAHLYSPAINFVYPEYRSCNISGDTTRIFFSLKVGDLLQMKSLSSDQFFASIAITYRVFTSYESKLTVDTGMFYYEVPESDQKDQFVGYFDIKAPDSTDYVVQITLTDMNRNQAVESFCQVDRTGIQPAQDFMVIDDSSGSPFINPFTDRPAWLRIMNLREHSGPLYMRYFRNTFPVAPPPFSDHEQKQFSYRAWSTTRLEWPLTGPVYLGEPGIYHFQFDTLVKEGLTLFVFEPGFPNLTTHESMIESIRFITNRQEYDKMLHSNNKREAIDNFWLEMSGNRERARVLIKSYYSRVQTANKLFTSYCEGWKTDRGLLYIIFGPPSSMYITNTTENWNYSQNYNYGPLNFTFDKVSNPFSVNDYRLRRSSYYEIPWYRAVESWRDGRVVNETD
jgi:GWxTD domain-containing protein